MTKVVDAFVVGHWAVSRKLTNRHVNRPMLPAAEGRRRSCTHKTQTDKTIWRTKRTLCVYSVPMILRDEIIIFKGGGVVSVSSCLLILNTLPHCKNVVLDIYNTVETIVSVTILKILVCFTHLNFA